MRPFVLPRACTKAAIFRLTTAARVQHRGQTPPPPLSGGPQGPSTDVAEGPVRSNNLKQFNSLEEMLTASGGADDEVYRRLSERSIAAYNADRESVDAQLLPVLKKNKLVLFLEGTVDNPKSLLSMNIVKILTQLQSVPLTAIDVTTHPAILGFALNHGRKKRCPLLFLDGVCLGSHDSLVQLYQSGVLARQIAGQLPPTSPYFPGELPIALY
ncbi:Chromosome III, complete sequence, related [Eimeria praecox]|uniref:Chromosome III, complete sequence, related n=1 Tax=Eimeria praecox TaxID=51316 RepID=U6GYL5_9EIME|nr:Chromosome III, complete sequence, related [Eimeria praecox]